MWSYLLVYYLLLSLDYKFYETRCLFLTALFPVPNKWLAVNDIFEHYKNILSLPRLSLLIKIAFVVLVLFFVYL